MLVLTTGLPLAIASIDGVTGITVPPGNSEALADAINGLLDNPGLRSLLGHRARLRAHRKFSAQQMARSMLQLYREVLDDAVRAEGMSMRRYPHHESHRGREG